MNAIKSFFKKNNQVLFLIVAVLLLILAGYLGYRNFLLRKEISEFNSKPLSVVVVTPTPEPIEKIPVSSVEPSCAALNKEVTTFEFCEIPVLGDYDFIRTSDGGRIEHVLSYSVSPNNKRVFVVRASEESVIHSGAPQEEAISMINLETGEVREFFSQIYFVNFIDEKSWRGNGIVFTAGGATTPPSPEIDEADPFAVVYCEMSCRVLAEDAGPVGIGGEAAYFENGLVHYSRGELGTPVEISL